VPRLLHLHVHYRLVLGEYWRTSYRVPLEAGMLASAARGDLFRIPAPTYQFLIFMLRTVLMQRGKLLLGTGNRWRRGIQIQLDNLEALCPREELAALLAVHLPTIDVPFLDRCAASLRGRNRLLERALLLHLLHHRLRDYSRLPSAGALLQAAAEKVVAPEVLRRVADERMRPVGGGTVIALVGGDGAGKSTCARELENWLSRDFAAIRVHLGNPPRSLLTFMAGGALKVEGAINRLLGRPPRTATHLELLRHLCAARDRYRLHGKVQRFAAQGGIAVCERYPLSEIPSHVGPCIPALLGPHPTAFARIIRNAEAWYCERMRRPDLLFVLRLDPELAVIRKPEEPADYVRTRGRTIWETEWTGTRAELVDAARPLGEVLDDLKARVWPSL
jgi:thymidylate kinase